MAKTLFLTTALLVITNISCAEIYKWVDENGKVHFSQTPPDEAAEKIEVPDNQTPIDQGDFNKTKEKNRRYLEYLRQERQEKNARKARQDEKQAKLDARCKSKLADYQGLQAGGRFYEFNSKGERIYLSNDQIAEAKKELQQFLDTSCL